MQAAIPPPHPSNSAFTEQDPTHHQWQIIQSHQIYYMLTYRLHGTPSPPLTDPACTPRTQWSRGHGTQITRCGQRSVYIREVGNPEHWRQHQDSRLAKTRTVCGLADEQWLELSMAGTSSSADRPFDAFTDPCLSSTSCSVLVSFIPPPPLYKLRPCPSYSRRRDRIHLGPNFNSVPNVVQPHKTWVW